jgi:hypothetical protein
LKFIADEDDKPPGLRYLPDKLNYKFIYNEKQMELVINESKLLLTT